LKFVQALWTYSALLLKYDAFTEEDCLEGHHCLNSYKSKDYSFYKKFRSNPDYTCGSTIKAFHFISNDKKQNTAISAVIIVIGFIIKDCMFSPSRSPNLSLSPFFLLQISEIVN